MTVLEEIIFNLVVNWRYRSYEKTQNFNISKIMPVRLKNTGTWGIKYHYSKLPVRYF